MGKWGKIQCDEGDRALARISSAGGGRAWQAGDSRSRSDRVPEQDFEFVAGFGQRKEAVAIAIRVTAVADFPLRHL